MNLDVVKPEKYEHLYLVYHSTIPGTTLVTVFTIISLIFLK